MESHGEIVMLCFANGQTGRGSRRLSAVLGVAVKLRLLYCLAPGPDIRPTFPITCPGAIRRTELGIDAASQCLPQLRARDRGRYGRQRGS
jgi:hypothetical protein